MKNFIKTQDENVAAQLRAAHFSYLGKDITGVYVFVNDDKYEFAESDTKKIVYTNVLNL